MAYRVITNKNCIWQGCLFQFWRIIVTVLMISSKCGGKSALLSVWQLSTVNGEGSTRPCVTEKHIRQVTGIMDNFPPLHLSHPLIPDQLCGLCHFPWALCVPAGELLYTDRRLFHLLLLSPIEPICTTWLVGDSPVRDLLRRNVAIPFITARQVHKQPLIRRYHL